MTALPEIPVRMSVAEFIAELLRRNEDGSWPLQPLSLEAGTLTLDSIGFSAPLASAGRTTKFAAKA